MRQSAEFGNIHRNRRRSSLNGLTRKLQLHFTRRVSYRTIAFRYRDSFFAQKQNTPGASDQAMMGNPKCGRKNLCLGMLVIAQILCLAQANSNKPNGWDSVLEPDLQRNGGGAKNPSTALRGKDRELRHKVSASDRGHLGITGAFVSSRYLCILYVY